MSLDAGIVNNANNTPSITITYNNKQVTPVQSCDTLVETEDKITSKLKDTEFHEAPPTSELNVNTLKSKNLSKCGLVRFESTKDIHFANDGDYDPYGTDIQSDEDEAELSGDTPSSRPENNTSKQIEEQLEERRPEGEEALVVFKSDKSSGIKPPSKNETILEKLVSWFSWSYSSKPAAPLQPMSVPLKTVTKTGTVASLTTTTTLAVRPKSGLFEFRDNGDLLVDNVEFAALETKPVQYKYNGELRTSWDRVKESTVDMLPSTSSKSGGPGLVQRLIVKALLSPTRNNLSLPTKDQFYRLMTKIPRPLTIAFTSSGASFDTLKLIEEDKERKRRSFRVKQNYFDNNEDFEIRDSSDELKVVELKEISKSFKPRIVVLNS